MKRLQTPRAQRDAEYTPSRSTTAKDGALRMAIVAAWLGLFSDTTQERNKKKAARQGKRVRARSRSRSARSVRRLSERATQQNATATGEQQ